MIYRSKYGNKKITVNGETFDSQKEYRRWCELKQLERAGAIKNLKRQVKFELLPAQYCGKNCAERALNYIADFTYIEPLNADRNEFSAVVEDVKGKRTQAYIIKRKLMLYLHGIRIKEI